MIKGAVFPLFYLPNVEFFKNLQNNKSQTILIEREEHYVKQSFRNRTAIAGPNGKLELTVPVKKGSIKHTLYKDIKISNDDNWQRIHWLSLETSYRSSAYFEFYEDAFLPFYEKKYEFLFDYNLEFLNLILKLIKMPIDFQLTSTFEKSYDDFMDLRGNGKPNQLSGYENKKYYQVFEDKLGYLNNISVVDLLFNQGPQASKFF